MPSENTARKNAPQGLRALPGKNAAMKDDHFNAVIHERTRLAIVSALAVNASLSFSELKKSLELTDGNLSIHTQKLEAAGYLDCRKGYRGRVPRTEYRLTRKGRRALEEYLNHMERLIHAVRDG